MNDFVSKSGFFASGFLVLGVFFLSLHFFLEELELEDENDV